MFCYELRAIVFNNKLVYGCLNLDDDFDLNFLAIKNMDVNNSCSYIFLYSLEYD